MLRAFPGFRLLALIIGASCASTAVPAASVIDPPNDLRTFDPNNTNSYAGPANSALDVLSVNVILNPGQNTLTFMQTMAGPISSLVNPTNGAPLGSYSWGINHGYSSSNFSEINLPNVLFDAVLTLNPNGTGSYRGARAPPGSVTVSGDTLTAVLPISFLAPPPQPANAQGPLLSVDQWSYNLWPRSSIKTDGSALGFGDAQIADFAPNTNDFAAQVVPEPASAVILATGIVGAGFFGRLMRRRKNRAIANY